MTNILQTILKDSNYQLTQFKEQIARLKILNCIGRC